MHLCNTCDRIHQLTVQWLQPILMISQMSFDILQGKLEKSAEAKRQACCGSMTLFLRFDSLMHVQTCLQYIRQTLNMSLRALYLEPLRFCPHTMFYINCNRSWGDHPVNDQSSLNNDQCPHKLAWCIEGLHRL